MKITLPYPPAACSPNARNLWAGIKARRKYRAECWAECLAQGLGKMPGINANLTLTFCPPDNRHRDLDNALASMKSGLDAIADVIGIDDSKWAISFKWGAPVKGGRVEVEIDG